MLLMLLLMLLPSTAEQLDEGMQISFSAWFGHPSCTLCLTPPLSPSPCSLTVAIMRKQRQLLFGNDAPWLPDTPGWHPDSHDHPCQWNQVDCDEELHIIRV